MYKTMSSRFFKSQDLKSRTTRRNNIYDICIIDTLDMVVH